MNVFRETYYIYRRNFKVWIAEPVLVVSSVVLSAFMFLAFAVPLGRITQLPGFPTGNFKSYFTALVVVQAVVSTGSDMAIAMLTDMLSGYFDKLLLAPVHRSSILLGSLLMAGTRALVQAAAVVLMALAMGVDFKGGPLGILVVLALGAIFGLASACLGLIVAIKTRSVQVTQSLWLCLFPLMFLTTGFMPKEFLPGWLKIAVTLNPFNYV